MSNAQSIFSSNYAIRLAKDMAESRQVMGPAETFRRLIIFSGIGFVSLVSGVVAIVLLNTELAIDTNSRTFFLFLSLASALVLIATIGASLLFLWDSFLGQYVQRLALLDEDLDAITKVENSDDVFVIRVLRPEDLLGTSHEPIVSTFSVSADEAASENNDAELIAESSESILDVSVVVHDKKLVRNNDMSTKAVRDQLIALRNVTPHEDWKKLGFDKHLAFFQNLGEDATIKTVFDPVGQYAFSLTLVALANPRLATRVYGLNVLSDQLGKIAAAMKKTRAELRPHVA